jgi:pilus assembly protein CpaD
MEFVRMNCLTPTAGESVPGFLRSGRRLRSAAALGALALLLGGCTHMKAPTIDRHVIVGSIPEDYRTTHPIAIEEGVETMDLPAGLNVIRLTDAFKGSIRGFARGYLGSGSATIAIVTPAGSRNENPARALAGQIQEELIAAGVEAKSIEFRVYRAQPSEVTAPIRLAYSKVGAHTAGCGPWPDQFNRNADNRNYFNYGCATQQNLAAMVANPLDLLYPRDMSASDATRRSGVIGSYEGDPAYRIAPSATQGNYALEPSAKIAQGVGN